MKLSKTLVAAATLALALPAAAQTFSVVALNFDNILVADGDGFFARADVLQYYNGGASAAGTTGPDYGITFAAGAAAISRNLAEGDGSFTNNPSGVSALGFGDSVNSMTLDFSDGFKEGFAFRYASSSGAVSVTVYRGPNGLGNEVGSIILSETSTAGCSAAAAFCNWRTGTLSFSGVAQSVVFRGLNDQLLFDDITFGATDPRSVSESTGGGSGGTGGGTGGTGGTGGGGTDTGGGGVTPAIPEPSTYALMALGLGVVAWRARRRTR